MQTYPIVNLIGATNADARDIMVRRIGILACCRRDKRPGFLAADLRLEWPNGAVSQLFSAEEPDRLRGKQDMKLWCDELAALRQPEAFDQAMLGLSLGDRPQAVITTTPRPSKTIKTLAAGKDTIVTRGRPSTTGPIWRERSSTALPRAIRAETSGGRSCSPKSSRRRRRLVVAGLLERQRVAPEGAPTEFAEIVVAIDPPARSGSKSDECGLIVAAKAESDSSMCSPTSPARARRRARGARGSAPPFAASRPSRGRRDQPRRRHGDGGVAPERAQPAGARGSRDAGQIPARRADRRGL